MSEKQRTKRGWSFCFFLFAFAGGFVFWWAGENVPASTSAPMNVGGLLISLLLFGIAAMCGLVRLFKSGNWQDF